MAACDRGSDEATGAKLSNPDVGSHIVRLSEKAIQQVGLRVRRVGTEAFAISRDFPATVQPNANRLADITTLVRGRAVDIHVDLGEDVKAGAVLATLESSELGLAQSAYLKAGAKLFVAERAFTRAKTLLEGKVIGQADYQRREGEWITAQAEVQEAQDRLRLLGMKEHGIRRLTEEKTIRSTVSVVAPFDGRVIARNVVRGEVVETHDKLFALADLSEVWVVGNVPEKDVSSIHRGQTVEIKTAAYPHDTFQGQITYVSDVLDPSTRTMRVRVSVRNPDIRLKPEMFATIRVWSADETNVLAIPSEAVQQDRGEAVVFVQTDTGQFERRSVRLGDDSGGLVRVLDGLHVGELIVTKGAFELKSELTARQQGSPLP